MGYDMRWRKVEASEEDAVAELRRELYALCAVRDALPKSEAGRFAPDLVKAGADPDSHDAYEGRSPRFRAAQDQVQAASVAVYEARNSYFRIGAFSMSTFMDLMLRLGMAFEDEPHPAWPKADEFGTTWDDVDAAENPEDYPDHVWASDSALVAALKLKEASDAVLAFHGKADTPGIPEHKFSSNDGWIVVPAECEAAVRIWQKFVKDEGEEKALAVVGEYFKDAGRWLEWIRYLAGATRHDGFEVH